MTLLNDHVAEEDLKLFRHVKELTAKVRRVSVARAIIAVSHIFR